MVGVSSVYLQRKAQGTLRAAEPSQERRQPEVKAHVGHLLSSSSHGVLHHHQGANFRCYPKWNKRGHYGAWNHGDVASLANRWLEIQGQSCDGHDFDRNCGRKSLARWLAELGIPYKESIHVHGDLEEVWRDAYQDGLHKSHYRVREQSKDADTATKALRSFAKWINGRKIGPTLKEKLREILAAL